MDQSGIGNGDCVLSKSNDGSKLATLFYDGLLTERGNEDPENLTALKAKFSSKAPVFKIQYKPRQCCK
jgi:hypothetical protein